MKSVIGIVRENMDITQMSETDNNSKAVTMDKDLVRKISDLPKVSKTETNSKSVEHSLILDKDPVRQNIDLPAMSEMDTNSKPIEPSVITENKVVCENSDQPQLSEGETDKNLAISEKEVVRENADLPLMSNTDQILAAHYSIQLNCNLDQRIFSGSVKILFNFLQDTNEVVLDCCDIKISAVFVHNVRNVYNQSIKTEVAFHQTEWALVIDISSISRSSVNEKEMCIEIVYQTNPDTRSLHWRNDADGKLCAYTPASAINNRGLFPCQDVPGSMSTWDFTLALPSDSETKVFCTGDTSGTVSAGDDCQQTLYKFSTDIVLPMSTFAIAIGAFNIVQVACPVVDSVRLIGCPSDLSKITPQITSYLSAALSAAVDILGVYPLPRLDIVIVSQYFSGLGLASPNLMFLSPTVFSGDPAFLIKISHEICHAWFGIMLGAKDWSEVWLSEGFATFLEDFVHHRACGQVGLHSSQDLIRLRAYTRYKGLCSEAGYVTSDLQQLRPMKGEKLLDQDHVSYVKHGLDPEAGLLQSHYLKGYFLLHYLMEKVGEDKFLSLIKAYFNKYKGELVDSTYFLSLFYERFNSSISESMEDLMSSWLDLPGLPGSCHQIQVHQVATLPAYTQVVDLKEEILHLNSLKTKSADPGPGFSTSLPTSEQIIILFDQLLNHKLNGRIMKKLRESYEEKIFSNPDLWHLWCELVISNKYKKSYQDVVKFLEKHQSMGVYLYSELASSRNNILIQVFTDVFSKIEENLDPNMKIIISQYTEYI